MLRQVLLVLAAAAVANAAVYVLNLEDKPAEYANCEGCWLSDIQEFIGIGEKRPVPNECEEYQCNKDYVQKFTCGVVEAESPYEITVDKSKPYPYCCPQIVYPQPVEPKPPVEEA